MNDRALLEIVRNAIMAEHAKQRFSAPDVSYSPEVQGVFVTLWGRGIRGKKLRGCIGRHFRKYQNLGQEIAECAVAAAFQDPRFGPVTPEEVPELEVEISLLDAPVEVNDVQELDPNRYGVIMEVESGLRKATLLPDIEGINSVSEQLGAVRQKAGISPEESVRLYKFAVRKVSL